MEQTKYRTSDSVIERQSGNMATLTREEREEYLQLLKTPDSKLEIGVKYEGEALYGFYEVQSSSGEWCKQVVIINSQEELNELVKKCNFCDTMNLLGFLKE